MNNPENGGIPGNSGAEEVYNTAEQQAPAGEFSRERSQELGRKFEKATMYATSEESYETPSSFGQFEFSEYLPPQANTVETQAEVPQAESTQIEAPQVEAPVVAAESSLEEVVQANAPQDNSQEVLQELLQVETSGPESTASVQQTKTGNPAEIISPYSPEQTLNKAKNNKGLKQVLKRAAVVAAGIAIVGASIVGTAVAALVQKDKEEAAKSEKTAISGELQNGVTYNYEHYANRNKKESYNAYDYDQSKRFGDREATEKGIMEVAERTPEALASYAYDLLTPEEKAELGIDGMTMTEIDDYMSNNPKGGELQRSLLDKIEKVLASEDTSYQFYYENDTESTNYIYFVDDNNDGVMTPNELHVGYDTCKRNGAPQVDISRKLYKTSGKTYKVKMLDLNYLCGFQPNYEEDEVPEGVPHIPANPEKSTEPSSTNPTETTKSTDPESTNPKPTDPKPTQPDTQPSTQWGKSGDPHGGDKVKPSDKVNPKSQVTKEKNDNTNKGNQGYKDDNKATPGSSSNNNRGNNNSNNSNSSRLSGGTNQGGSQTNGENAYHSPSQNSQGQKVDNSGNAAQQEARQSGGENGGGASAGGDNYSDAAEESAVENGDF